MLFSRKATKVLDEQTKTFEEREIEREKKVMKGEERERLQWKDIVAMWIAGFITFVPAIILVCCLFALIIWLFFLRFM